MAKPIKVSIGEKFGRWTVIKELSSQRQPNGKSIRVFLCECECGNQANVQFTSLRNNRSKSCGCYMKEVNGGRIGKQSITHGNTPVGENEYKSLYFVWNSMKARCYNKNSNHYYNYGGRGIVVCEDWKNDFSKFRDWSIVNGYYKQPKDTPFKNKLSIDRKDNNGNYCPENCRWITVSQNSSRK